MDSKMATVMANHATILSELEWIVTQYSHQHSCTEALKREVAEMRVIVEQVRELLAALKGISLIAKWATVIGGGVVAVWHGAKWILKWLSIL